MQGKNKSDDEPLPPRSSECIPSQHVSTLLLHKGKENAGLPWAARSGASQHNQIGKTESPDAEAKVLGPGQRCNRLFRAGRIWPVYFVTHLTGSVPSGF